jgi:hypothetical protein
MNDQQSATDDRRAELDRLESELVEQDKSITGVRDSMTDGGPMDPEDRAAAMIQIEELEAVREGLQRRRDALRDELGVSD